MPGSLLSDTSCLLVVDVQQRLLKAMPEDRVDRFLHANKALVELADELGADILYTEQYPDGLGPTESDLLETLKKVGADRIEKTSFDACSADAFRDHLVDLPEQLVVCGMETHICVYTTVRELISHRHQVAVPFDAVISRRAEYHHNGLQMMSEQGATITNYETIVFDALGSSKHPAFKRFSKVVRNTP